MKYFSHFLYCSFLISFFVCTSDTFRLHEAEAEQHSKTLNIATKPSSLVGLGIEARSRYESPPAFFRDLYNFLQSEKSVGEKGVDFLAEPSQSISSVENETYVHFLLHDVKFTSRQQFHLVFTKKKPVRANQHFHGIIQNNEDGDRSAELLEVADGNFSNAFGAQRKYVEETGFTSGEYKVFNATEMISYVRAGNERQVVIKVSMHLGNHSIDVNDSIETNPGNAKRPLLVAFNNFHLESFISFFNQNRAQPIERSEEPPNGHDDGLTTSDIRHKRETNSDCRLRDWFVGFNDIHWEDLVYVPMGYNAKFCHGSCHFGSPLRVLNTSWPVNNHVLIRSLFRHQMRQPNLLNGTDDLPPHSCCVPIQYEPLNMLYLEISEPTSYYVLRSVPNMIATKCGCA